MPRSLTGTILQCAQVKRAAVVPVTVTVDSDVPSEVRNTSPRGVWWWWWWWCCDGGRQINTDGGRLRQIILNGLTNAVKYSSSCATGIVVRVSVSARGMITFSVTDDGCGLPAGVTQEALFLDFNNVVARGHTPALSTRSARRVGMGLPIASRFVFV